MTSIRLSPDYGVELPLWGAEWWRLGLPAGLLDDLADWQEQFDVNHRPETGWITDDAASDWAHRGNELAAVLRDALPDTILLHVDLWPVAESRRRRWLNRIRR